MDAAAKILDLPLMLVSRSYKLLSYSSVHRVDDDAWTDMLFMGHYPEFLIRDILAKRKKLDMVLENGYFSERRDDSSKYTRLIVCLRGQHPSVEKIVALGTRPFGTEEEKDLLALTGELAIRKLRDENDGSRNASESLLINLIKNDEKSSETFRSNILVTPWENAQTMKLICTDQCERPLADHLIGLFRDVFQHSTVFYCNKHVVIYIYTDIDMTTDAPAYRSLDEILSANHIWACISEDFSDVLDVGIQYRKNVRVLKLSDAPEACRLLRYDDYIAFDPYLILSELDASFRLERFVYSKTLEIYEYDKANRTEYLKTIQCHLMCEKHPAKTAAQLYIHRNTVLYRLQRIKELFDYDFSSYSENFNIVLGQKLLELNDIILRKTGAGEFDTC